MRSWITFLVVGFCLLGTHLRADGGGKEKEEGFNPLDMIYHHVLDAHVWHLWDGAYGTLYLPIILYSSDRGLEIFSSARFFDHHHAAVTYRGYAYRDHHIVPLEEGRHVLDFSITKNVAALFLNASLLLLIFLSVSRRYRKYPNSPPKGLQSFLEPIVLFVRDEIVRPYLGEEKYRVYFPYLLTLFFFILLGNLVGLLPGAANLTGNISVTLVLAVITFLLTNLSGNRHYWGHIFNMPGVPLSIKPLLGVVEFIGLFTKPISLMIRLFVAITAGHIVILSLLGLIFIFESYAVGVASALVVLFINVIEIMVSIIQAYIFTMFTSLYIGAAVKKVH
ncbi:MAG: F0F1 ATP synthase subunit A [Cytophagales bacterium]|nr:F0F1 ATP synthase subunit A [Cytophagales bacterium]